MIYSIGHLGDQIRRHVGTGEPWGLKVDYVDEGRNLRGTGGALRQALDASALAEQFLVLYGDSYLSVDVRSVWEAFLGGSKRSSDVGVPQRRSSGNRSNVVFSDGMVTRYAKGLDAMSPSDMRYVDYGLSVFKRIDGQSNGCLAVPSWTLHDTFTALSAAGELAGYEADGAILRDRITERLEDLEQQFLSKTSTPFTSRSSERRSA